MNWVEYLNHLMPGLPIGSWLHGPDGQGTPPPSQTPGPGWSPQLENMLLGRPPDAPPPVPPPGAPATPHPTPGGLQTDQEVSGKAADAITKLHDEQAKRRDDSNNAAEQISDALLKAHPVTADGQKKLNTIQSKIIDAVNNPAMSLDTPAGEKAYLTFLQGQVSDIRELIVSGSLSDQDAASTLAALTGLIPADTPAGDPASTSAPTASAADPAVSADPGATDPGVSDPGLLGPDPSMPAPLDPSLMSGLSGLASAVPQMMSPLSGLGGLAGMPMSMIPPMSSMGGGGMGSPPPVPAVTDTAVTEKPHPVSADTAQQDTKPADEKQPEPTPLAEADTTPPAAEPSAPSTQVNLPDGSTATAANPAVAKAMNAYLKGEPLDAAFKDQGMTLPPPGTPVTTGAVDRSQVGCGTIGMFDDHYVVALSSSKAFSDGQVVPLAQVASGQGFQGWVDPAKLATPEPAPAPAL